MMDIKIDNQMIQIEPFQPLDQNSVRLMILRGLEEYWGVLDTEMNTDLDDIGKSYREGLFLVAKLADQIIGTGAYLPRSGEQVEVVRMSVTKRLRSRGIGRQILCQLCCKAHQNGYSRVILETTATWDRAIAFYQDFGFQITHYVNQDVYFALDLTAFSKKMPSTNIDSSHKYPDLDK
jgi:GNAT superfamily N-acetyltransferase